MKKYKELSISLIESHSKTIEILMSNLEKNWQRNKESEENLFSINGTKQICFDYIGKDAPKCRVWLNKKENEFCVANIIPQSKSELSIDEYNQVIDIFEKEVLSGLGIDYNISKADITLDDLLSEESCRKFRTFSKTSNKSTGIAHPSDEKKWLEFIYSTLKNDEYLALDDLRFFLLEDGWDEQTAGELSLDYEYGYEAMKHAMTETAMAEA